MLQTGKTVSPVLTGTNHQRATAYSSTFSRYIHSDFFVRPMHRRPNIYLPIRSIAILIYHPSTLLKPSRKPHSPTLSDLPPRLLPHAPHRTPIPRHRRSRILSNALRQWHTLRALSPRICTICGPINIAREGSKRNSKSTRWICARRLSHLIVRALVQ